MSFIILVLSILGFVASLYAFFVERKARLDSSYKPLCDINDRISCSRVFTSSYARFAGFSNALIGMFFYATLVGADLLGLTMLVFGLSFFACAGSLILAYLLYFKVKSFCLVCNVVYVINLLLLIFSYSNL